jgi:hypothetical protein
MTKGYVPVESAVVGYHMDLRPKNVLINQGDEPDSRNWKISNFGISTFKSLMRQKTEGETALQDDIDDIDSKSDISGNSNTLSVATIADSIFSSLAVLSRSSMSSLHASEDAANRLNELLLEDKVIHALCCKALSSIDRERFERNLRRLLKGFASELRKEAKSKEERSASHFVALRATNSAHTICNKLNRTRTGRITRIPATEEQDDDDCSDGSQSESSEDGLDGIQQLEIFIKTSQAIQILRENLKSFIEQFDEQNRKGNNDKIENVEHVVAAEPACLEVDGRSWVQQVMAFCDDALRIISQRSGPVEDGKTRIQWQCVSSQCKHTLERSDSKVRNVAIKSSTTSSRFKKGQQTATNVHLTTQIIAPQQVEARPSAVSHEPFQVAWEA